MATTGAPRLAGAGDGVGGRLRDDVALGVHRVLVEVVDGDGLEGAEADVQGDAGDVAPAHGEAPEEGVGEVQARGGRGDRAVVARVDGLVAVGVRRPRRRA